VSRELVALVEAAVHRGPDRPALEIDDTTLSYRQLWAAAGSVASALAGRGVSGRVGLRAGKTVDTYAAYLGILLAGCAVLPIGDQWPAARVADILCQAGVGAVVTDRHLDIPATGGASETPSGEAYVIFTSGSTGTPKGVPNSCAGTAQYLRHVIALYELGPGARLAQAADLTFDASVFEILGAWCSGATLVAAAGRAWRTPVRFLRERRITHLDTVPSVITIAERTRALRPNSLPDLRWSMFSGEQLTYQQVAAWRVAAPDSVIENNYGPSELAGVCARYRLPADPADWPRTENGTVPIGAVYPHLDSVVLDAARRPATEGELCVRGGQRFAGYVSESDNAGRFLRGEPGRPFEPVTGRPQPRDWYRTGDRVRLEHGELVHVGRVDRQVKLRGYRVELDEVEAAVRAHAAVTEVAVLVVDHQLHAYYLGDEVPPAELKEVTGQRVPTYMVPTTWRCVPEFPRTASGKLDRAALLGEVASDTRSDARPAA
jgi:amino acid adenylation domain-containing protein